jgi:predicted transcriptional regulator
MKRKVGTTLDAALYRQVKEIARRQGRTTNAVIEDALARFLATRTSNASVVAETKGTFRVPAKALRTILQEDLYDTD